MGILSPSDWASATKGSSVDVQKGLPQINFQAQAAKDQYGHDATALNTADFLGLYNGAQDRYNQTYGQQNDLIGDVRARANGTGGPSLAELQMHRATDANAQGAAGAIASQRGMNPAMAQRLVLNQRAQMGQQEAGQTAALRAQEQLQAQNQLGGLLAQQQGQNTGLMNMGIGANQAQNNMAFQNLWAQQGMDQSTAATNAGLVSAAQAQKMGLAGYAAQAGASAVGGALQGAGALGAQYMNNGAAAGSMTQPYVTEATQAYPGGGEIMMSTGMSDGGLVLGRPNVPGDSPRNDTVPARLSPGEVVIPRSIVDDPVATEEFMRVIRSHRADDEDTSITQPLRLGRSK